MDYKKKSRNRFSLEKIPLINKRKWFIDLRNGDIEKRKRITIEPQARESAASNQLLSITPFSFINL